MSLLSIAWRYLWARALVTLLTLAGVALGAALITAVLSIKRETQRAFLDEAALVDLVVGAKGSPLQLVLSSVYHLDVPTGNIGYDEFQRLRADPLVRRAIPIGLGDNTRGFRIVGTTPEFLDLDRVDLSAPPNERFKRLFEMNEGRWFDKDFEAVLGADVAASTGMSLGDTFVGTHGIIALAGSAEHPEFPYTVVGIMARSHTSNDRAVFVSLGSVWKVHEGEELKHRAMFGKRAANNEDAPTSPTQQRAANPNWLFSDPAAKTRQASAEVTSVLVQLHSLPMRHLLLERINRDTNAMAAIPAMEMMRLYGQVLAPVQRSLLVLAYLVVVVSALAIMATLIQSAERRRRDIAILRALGVRRWEVFALVLLEAGLLTTLGVACGWVLGQSAVMVAGWWMSDAMGVGVRAFVLDGEEWRALGWVLVAGIAGGLVPAALAYRRAPVDDLGATG